MADATTASPSMMTGAPESERIQPKRLFAFIIMVFGMFMSILDIQIVSASLTEIQAGLSASSTEVSWVQTAYLIAEVIAIPLSGFLSRALGTRLLFAISAIGFTVSSLLCGFASSIEQMILWRALQGFLGAGMIPTVFASAYTIFPRSKFYIVAPIIGLVATLAPTVGPTVGGYITDLMSWHWLFFINIVPGIIITIGVLALVDFDQPNFALLERFDWWGLIFMGGFLGSLEYVLEEGPQYEWLQDTSVAICAAVCFVSAIAFFWRVLTAEEPIVDLYAFSNRNFAVGCVLQFCVGIGLYGLTYVYPRYLAEIRGYSALMIGETMFISGLTMFFMAPVVGRLMQKVDLRYIIAFGLVTFALGSWQMTWITREYDFYELLVPQILRGIGMMCAMVPTNNIALATLQPDRVKNASGLFNLMRNLGGAVGLAVINEVLNDRTDLHISRLQDRVTWGNANAVETLNNFTQRLQGMGDAATMAMKQLSQLVHRQAQVMSYGDAFFMLSLFYVALSLLVLFVNKPPPMTAGGGDAH
ncbi:MULTISPECIES: DHA2 family efflux MFS transporter permease subunit [Bradyrhizobium]|jgi:DHA2 family multidrug resistance protein|uniref:DHA2 family efflux MFS transporter permease subunit n=1 Tax=Bradyrhizobium TaxID=374 RepID=UPI000410E829|nr:MULTISPECIES: DHA2 family efflux MFS transporter permease subunit [Bradyrhizobium]AUC98646.1 MFS transporter [Bradyrhizobium sp. SK17]KIU44025.1 MFS transporter [Bradyrhizobium elkanii]MBK5651740.1 DHA2 family efflux MFS transporter permease subunit [Rhizobium sp.]OCX27737.1 MFS transporter [Bradyrhizobium sp. UASWS1016]